MQRDIFTRIKLAMQASVNQSPFVGALLLKSGIRADFYQEEDIRFIHNDGWGTACIAYNPKLATQLSDAGLVNAIIQAVHFALPSIPHPKAPEVTTMPTADLATLRIDKQQLLEQLKERQTRVHNRLNEVTAQLELERLQDQQDSRERALVATRKQLQVRKNHTQHAKRKLQRLKKGDFRDVEVYLDDNPTVPRVLRAVEHAKRTELRRQKVAIRVNQGAIKILEARLARQQRGVFRNEELGTKELQSASEQQRLMTLERTLAETIRMTTMVSDTDLEMSSASVTQMVRLASAE